MPTLAEARTRLLFADFGRTLIVRPAVEDDPGTLFDEVCAEFENKKIEQDADGNVYIMAPTGGESSDRNSELTMQLRQWSKQDGRGRGLDSHAVYVLPDGSKRSPDGSWVGNEKIFALPKQQRKRFLRLVPEFVIELQSPSDRTTDLQEKMRQYIRNGVELGWLIRPDEQCVLVYRPERPDPEIVRGSSISGEGQVAGFTLDLKPIWQGLDI